MSGVPERLRRLMEQRSIKSVSEFARLCAVEESSMRQYLQGKTLPSFQNLVAIHEATGTPIDWLVTGKGSDKYTNTSPEISGSSAERLSIPIQKLAIRASAGAGGAVMDDNAEFVPVPLAIVDQIGLKPDQIRLLQGHGGSMEPTIGDGDLLLVDVRKDTRAQPADGKIYVFALGDDVYVKRLLKTPRGWTMRSDNRELYPSDELIPPNEPFRIFGRVRWTGRQL